MERRRWRLEVPGNYLLVLVGRQGDTSLECCSVLAEVPEKRRRNTEGRVIGASVGGGRKKRGILERRRESLSSSPDGH